MPALESDLRRQLENVVIQARDVAEAAARSALQKRAVDVAEPFSHFGPRRRNCGTGCGRGAVRSGDVRNADKTQSIDQLTQELAYEYWHRMLFARFLAENHLLMHPDGVAVSLEECEELATAATHRPRTASSWRRATPARCCRRFSAPTTCCWRSNSPRSNGWRWRSCWPACRKKTFLADDSLGWVYQFWQSKKKEEVNKSGEQDRRADAFRRDPALHRTLHGGVPAAQHHRGVVVRAAWHPGATGRGGRSGWQIAGRDGVPALARRRHARSGQVRGLAQDAGRVHDARPLLRQRSFPGGGVQSARAATDARRGADAQRRRAMPCCGTTCSAWNSIPAARRSPRSPWPWPRGSTRDGRVAIVRCRR